MDQDQNIRFVIILVCLVITFFYAREFRKFRKSETMEKTKYISLLIGTAIVLFVTTILAIFFAENILSNLEPLHYLLYLIVVFGIGLPVGTWLVKRSNEMKKARQK